MREQIRKLEVQSRFSSISMKKRIPERLEEEARSEEITKEITQEKFPEWRDLILQTKRSYRVPRTNDENRLKQSTSS